MINIGTEETPVEVYVEMNGGMVDAYVRAQDYDTFIAAALFAEILYQVTETVTDPETGEETQEPTGEIATSSGVEISHLGSCVTTPAITNAEGEVVTPAVFDHRHHANIRMGEPAISQRDEQGNLKWHKWASHWSTTGADDLQRNRVEKGRVVMGVSLVDPETISSKERTIL